MCVCLCEGSSYRLLVDFLWRCPRCQRVAFGFKVSLNVVSSPQHSLQGRVRTATRQHTHTQTAELLLLATFEWHNVVLYPSIYTYICICHKYDYYQERWNITLFTSGCTFSYATEPNITLIITFTFTWILLISILCSTIVCWYESKNNES